MVLDNHVSDDLPAFALGVLSPDERGRIEQHLRSCSLCQAELAGFAETIGQMSLAIPQVAPSPGLKSRILDQISAPRRPASNPFQYFLRWFRFSPALSIAGATLIIVLLFSNILLWNQVANLNQMQRHGYAAVLLNGTPASSTSTGMVVYTQDGVSGFLVVNQLAQLPSDQQYQLWLIKGDERVSGGVFSVSEDGYSVMEIESTKMLTSFDGFGITIEPAGGSPGPTGTKVLGGSF